MVTETAVADAPAKTTAPPTAATVPPAPENSEQAEWPQKPPEPEKPAEAPKPKGDKAGKAAATKAKAEAAKEAKKKADAERKAKLDAEQKAKEVADKKAAADQAALVARVWNGEKKRYADDLLVDAAALDKFERETVPQAVSAVKAIGIRVAEMVKYKRGILLADMRVKFGDVRLPTVKGKAAPGSWPHFCAHELAKIDPHFEDEKYCSALIRAVEYCQQNGEDARLKRVVDAGADNKEFFPSAHLVRRLPAIKDEPKRKVIHAKLFSGEFKSDREFHNAVFAAGGPKAPEPKPKPTRTPWSGGYGHGSAALLKQNLGDLTLDEDGKETQEELRWVGACVEDAMAKAQESLDELKPREDEEVLVMVVVKKK